MNPWWSGRLFEPCELCVDCAARGYTLVCYNEALLLVKPAPANDASHNPIDDLALGHSFWQYLANACWSLKIRTRPKWLSSAMIKARAIDFARVAGLVHG
jgi:hypothetical protein